jgi:hypothetical protein
VAVQLRGLAISVIAAAACTGSRGPVVGQRTATRGPPAVIEARVVHTIHAPTIDVPWWWRGAAPPDADTCRQIADGHVGELGGDQVMAAVLAIDGDALRLGDSRVLALTDGVVPADAREDASIVPLAAALRSTLEGQNAYLTACGRAGDPIDVLLAAAPDTPQHTVLAVMYTLVHAGVERTFLAVGGREGVRWKPGFAVEEEQLVLTLAGDAWQARISGDRGDDAALADLAGVPALLQGRRLGCAMVPLRLGEPWSRAVAEMDALAGLGAHQFTLGSTEYAAPVAHATGAPGQRIAVRVGGTVAALPNIRPKVFEAEAGPVDHVRGMSPCVGLTARRGTPPTPEELEKMRRAFERSRDDADVWAPLVGPKQ